MFEVIYGGVKNSYLEIRRIGHICENQRIHIHCFLIPMEWDSVILILKESSKINFIQKFFFFNFSTFSIILYIWY